MHDERSSDKLASMHDVMVEAYAHIDQRMKHGGATGIPTGFTDFDNLTGGLHGSELVVLAARPSMGKTALATNIADHVSVESGVTTLMVSLEMARLELGQRMLCARGKIDGRKFRGGYLSGEDREALVKASAELSKAPLFIDDSPSRTITEIAARHGDSSGARISACGHRLSATDRAGESRRPAAGASRQDRRAFEGAGEGIGRAGSLSCPA